MLEKADSGNGSNWTFKNIDDVLWKEAGCTTELDYTEQLSSKSSSFAESKEEQRRIVGILDEAFDGLAAAEANIEKNLESARSLCESELQAVFLWRGRRVDGSDAGKRCSPCGHRMDRRLQRGTTRTEELRF